MSLYLVRHASAVNVGEQGVRRDDDRVLSERGNRQALAIARVLAAAGMTPARVVSSPLVRAVQTARIIAEQSANPLIIEEDDILSPGAEPRDVVAWLRKQPEGDIMLVMHMPDVADLADCLLTRGRGASIHFGTGACCCFSFDGARHAGMAVLEWHLRPELFMAE